MADRELSQPSKFTLGTLDNGPFKPSDEPPHVMVYDYDGNVVASYRVTARVLRNTDK